MSTRTTPIFFAFFLIGIGMTLLQVAGNPIMRDATAKA